MAERTRCSSRSSSGPYTGSTPGWRFSSLNFASGQGGVAEFLATYRTGAMLIFVHRDSENLGLDERRREFQTLERQNVVPVVPVRVSESWLLFDGPAIAKAAGSPSSQVPAPGVAQIENIPDPKDHLDELLFQAAGAPTGRRGKIFRRSITTRRVSVAEYISDYSPLENVPAFRSFQEVLAERYPYRNQLGQ